MKPFTAKLLFMQASPSSTSLRIDMEKQAPFDHRTIVLFETNVDMETLAFATNLVVGQNYIFPDALQHDSSTIGNTKH
jgi:hypothetical protein